MSITIEIPDSIVQGMKLPRPETKNRLKIELALSLYAQEILSFGKARQLAGMGKYQFGILLGERKIARHYSQEDLEEDLEYAGYQ